MPNSSSVEYLRLLNVSEGIRNHLHDDVNQIHGLLENGYDLLIRFVKLEKTIEDPLLMVWFNYAPEFSHGNRVKYVPHGLIYVTDIDLTTGTVYFRPNYNKFHPYTSIPLYRLRIKGRYLSIQPIWKHPFWFRCYSLKHAFQTRLTKIKSKLTRWGRILIPWWG